MLGLNRRGITKYRNMGYNLIENQTKKIARYEMPLILPSCYACRGVFLAKPN